MPLSLYKLHCPQCGYVEGYVSSEVDDLDADQPESDSLIEEEDVQSSAGPSKRCRCPQCGTWVPADRVQPA